MGSYFDAAAEQNDEQSAVQSYDESLTHLLCLVDPSHPCPLKNWETWGLAGQMVEVDPKNEESQGKPEPEVGQVEDSWTAWVVSQMISMTGSGAVGVERACLLEALSLMAMEAVLEAAAVAVVVEVLAVSVQSHVGDWRTVDRLKAFEEDALGLVESLGEVEVVVQIFGCLVWEGWATQGEGVEEVEHAQIDRGLAELGGAGAEVVVGEA